MSFFDKIFDSIAWIKIFISPFLVGAISGTLLWMAGEDMMFKLASVACFSLGTVLGVFFAEKIRKKTGTQEFDARIYRTPETEKEKYSK